MKNSPVTAKSLLFVGATLALAHCLVAWFIVRFFNSEAQKAFESHLQDIALISSEMDHQATAELCKNNSMTFHRITPSTTKEGEFDITEFGNEPEDIGIIDNLKEKETAKSIFNDFYRNPSIPYATKELKLANNNRYAYAFVPARNNENCVLCHESVGITLDYKDGELVAAFGVSASLEDLYKREQKFMIICAIGALLLVSVLGWIIHIMVEKLKEVDKRSRMMLDSAPLGSFFWDSNFNLIDSNLETLRLFEISTKEELINRFFELSPEFQPDGSLSREKSFEVISAAMKKGRYVIEWMHQKIDGELIPVELTLVSSALSEGQKKDVIAYARDLREIKDKTAKLDVAEKMAFSDALTGIYNRRYFMQCADFEFNSQPDVSSRTGIIMLDIDHFKKINDTYGHDAGDEALKLTTITASSVLRDSDLFARFGGEEFIVMVKNLELEGLANLAARICKKVESMDFYYEGIKIPITVSAGVTVRNSLMQNAEDVIKRADQALYLAKENGRNRVEVYIENLQGE
ncbi:MAG: sensor domain-containing diguanylate cyclase [Holophagaceae bacterium]|nr:sensor domain-containing diguanylate cyclase [Holophagaceae bacterium]